MDSRFRGNDGGDGNDRKIIVERTIHMEEKEIIVTANGIQKMKEELAIIENKKLKEIATKIAEAKDLGDLAENSEYHEAKEGQAFLNGKAQELRYKIRHAKIIKNNQSDVIVACSLVKIKIGDGVQTLTLVGSDESDPANGMISVDSPIGKALLGHRAGEKISITTPRGETEYQIIEVK